MGIVAGVGIVLYIGAGVDTGTGTEGGDGTVTPPAMEPRPEAPLSPSIAETLSDPERRASWA